MIIVVGTIQIDPNKVADATSAAVKMMEATHAEDGNIEYSFSEVLGSPGLIQIVEKWADQAALDAHFTMPHMAEFGAAMADFGITETSVLAYDAANERKLM